MTDTSITLMLVGIIVGFKLVWKYLMTRRPGATALSLRRAEQPVNGQHVRKIAGGSVTKESTTMRESRLIIEQIAGFLDARQTAYRLNADEATIETGFVYPTAKFLVTISVREAAPFLCVVTQMPMVIPEARRPAVAELIVRINYGLMLGGFALDLSDGELHFRVTMPLADAELTQEQFAHLLGASLWSADRYHKAFCRLLYGDDLSPAEAVAEVEMAK